MRYLFIYGHQNFYFSWGRQFKKVVKSCCFVWSFGLFCWEVYLSCRGTWCTESETDDNDVHWIVPVSSQGNDFWKVHRSVLVYLMDGKRLMDPWVTRDLVSLFGPGLGVSVHQFGLSKCRHTTGLDVFREESGVYPCVQLSFDDVDRSSGPCRVVPVLRELWSGVYSRQ